MSADNYIFVGKDKETGKYTVSERFASLYYSDEVTEAPMEGHGFDGNAVGWTIPGDTLNEGVIFDTYDEAEKAATRRPDWIQDPPTPVREFDSLPEAIMFAHKYHSEQYVVEYGVQVDRCLIKSESI